MSLYDQIRDLIGTYSNGAVAVERFRSEFVSLLMQTTSTERAASNLALDVESTYADFAAGVIDAEQLKRQLRKLAPMSETNPIELTQAFSTVGDSRPSLVNAQSTVNSSSRPPEILEFELVS